MRFFGFFAFCLLFGSQVHALSCMRPNIAATFNLLQKSDLTYRIAVGTIQLTQKPPRYVEGKPRRVRAKFQGRFVGLNGLGSYQSLPISVQTHCVAHWCGGFPDKPKQKFLMFLQRDGDGNTLTIDACP